MKYNSEQKVRWTSERLVTKRRLQGVISFLPGFQCCKTPVTYVNTLRYFTLGRHAVSQCLL